MVKPLDPDKCPTMVKVLDSICYLYDAQHRPVYTRQISTHGGIPRPHIRYPLNALIKAGYVHMEWQEQIKRNQVGPRPQVFTPLYRSNGEPYKRDLEIAAQIQSLQSNNPLKPAICPPGYARGYKISPVTVRPTAPYKPSTEGMW